MESVISVYGTLNSELNEISLFLVTVEFLQVVLMTTRVVMFGQKKESVKLILITCSVIVGNPAKSVSMVCQVN